MRDVNIEMERSIMENVEKGVKYTKLGNKYYSDEHFPYGQRVNRQVTNAINRLKEKKLIDFVGGRLIKHE